MKLIFSLLKSSFEGDYFRMISKMFNFLPNHSFRVAHKKKKKTNNISKSASFIDKLNENYKLFFIIEMILKSKYIGIIQMLDFRW